MGNRFEIYRRLVETLSEFDNPGAMIASFQFLSMALKTLPMGTAYAIWTGIGAVGTAILGILLFDESRDLSRILCILLIVAGIAGLKLTSAQ